MTYRVLSTLSNTCLLCNNYIMKGVGMCEVRGQNHLEFKVKTNFAGKNYLKFSFPFEIMFSKQKIVLFPLLGPTRLAGPPKQSPNTQLVK